ncbi:unnamed protein product [Rotaria socialis]|uniref:Uncharacterized protein n=1 Tax=Rotaria socialis TaxID=392032 RepID=A0A818YIT1_9BILA|nr:unnamed protein product [Rotaria socialis]
MSNSRTPHPPPSRFPPRPPRARPFELIAMQPPVRHHGYSNNFNYSHTSRPNVPRDELDSQLVRLGVFKSNEESAAPGSKFLTQAYDGIHNESRGTGVAKHVIADGKLAIFGASTGQRYAFNMQVLLFYQRERRSFVDGDVLPIFYKLVPSEKIRTKRRNIDIESDGSTLSANPLLNRLIKENIAKSGDVNRPPHVRALYVKRAQKLSRIIENTHLYLTAIYLLTSNDFDLFNYVSFREGSETAHSIE